MKQVSAEESIGGTPGGAAPTGGTAAEVRPVDHGLIERDVLAGVHEGMRTTAGTMVPGSFAIPVVYWWSANRVGMLIGMAIALAVSLPIFAWLNRLDIERHPNPRRALAIANGLANGIWALLPLWMMPEQPERQYLVIALPFAMLVTNLAATASVRRVYLAGQIPLAAGAMLAFLWLADGNTKWAAVVIAMTVLALDGLGRDWSRTALRSATLQQKNDRLVTDLGAANRVLAHRSRHDPLTGLPNRRAFTEFLDNAAAEQQPVLRPAMQLAVMLVDLDDFKAINDQYGHPCGDALLSTVADRLRSAVPAYALVCRLGGDEFAVAWQDAPTDGDLATVAARINEALRAPFVLDDLGLTISASIGFAVAGAQSPTIGLRRADRALYRAKADGRDRAVGWDPQCGSGAETIASLARQLDETSGPVAPTS